MQKLSVRNLMKMFSVTMLAQITALFVSVMMVLYTPNKIGTINYGYWQLYLMYASFVGFFHFGFNDGLYLRLGGKSFDELDKSSIKSQMVVVVGFEYIIGAIIFLVALFGIKDADKSFVICAVAINLVLVLPYSLLSYILQACGRVQWYSLALIVERLTFLIVLIICLECGINNYKIMIVIDLASRVISLVMLSIVNRKILFAKLEDLKKTMKEVASNVSIGIKLMISNIASMLIIAVGRLMIEKVWGIETFGKISLSISLANFLITFLTAISMVLYPILRNLNTENSRKIYHITRTLFMLLISTAMLCYVPMKAILDRLLPRYQEGIKYLAILFPMCLFEARMQLVSITYLKVYSKVNAMLVLNIISLAISIVLCSIAVFAFKNLNIAVMAILIAIAIRSILFDIYTEKIIGQHYRLNAIMEILLSIVFSFSAWYIGGWKSMLIYAAILIVYYVLNKNNIKNMIISIKEIRNGNL